MSREVVDLALSIVDARIELDDAPAAAAVLRRVWGGAARPLVAARVHAHYAVRALADGFAIENVARTHVREVPFVEDVVPFLEGALYADVMHAHGEHGLTVLHAAAFVDGAQAYVVLGESGAGKSALARAAVAAGLAYLADEHVVTDGRSLWGLPRAIHLDPVEEGAPPLPWHEGTDRTTYAYRRMDGVRMRLPIVPVDPERIARSPTELANAILVRARRGDVDAVAPIDATSRLTGLEACTLVGSAAGIAGLTGVRRGFELVWSEPSRALGLLRQATRGGSEVDLRTDLDDLLGR